MQPEVLWAPQAWVGGRWRDSVVLQVGAHGHWSAVTAEAPCPDHATRLTGAALPGLVNAHSHAFQRAFVGQAETRDSAHDDFWSWRDRMYRVALRITPEQLRAVAAHLYIELLRGGYTQVCEFHYLQHAPDGGRYGDPAAMCWALADAAADAGIGLTILPVLYERAGFQQTTLRDDQRRFKTTAHEVMALRDTVANSQRALTNAGLAIHSLRAASPASMRTLIDGAGAGPVHIHVAEQTAEVDDCLAATGCRPIEWLAKHAPLDKRWQLVHATHSTPGEIDAVDKSGAGVVLCPGTEANLGDGVADLSGWLAAGVPLSIGSDSQVTRSWSEELRWLEYGQRLVQRRRNVAASPASGQPSSAARLFERVRAGGAAAAGFTCWGLQVGARADLLVLNGADPALLGLARQHALDAAVFAAPTQPFSDVMVAGQWRLRGLQHTGQRAIASEFVAAMASLQA